MRPSTDPTMNAVAFSSATATGADPWRSPLSRNTVIALAVVALHAGLIVALQSGRLMRSAEFIVPAEVLAQLIDPPAPSVALAAPAAQAQPAPLAPKKPAVKPSTAPQIQPLAVAEPAPSPFPASTATAVAVPAAIAPPLAVTAAPAAVQSAPVLQLPSSDADYLQNPEPPYPPLSQRLGEAGKAIHKVWIGVDGKAQRAELVTSSGYARLDQAAYETVMRWRYVPGRRNGVAEAMPFNVPIHWKLRN